MKKSVKLYMKGERSIGVWRNFYQLSKQSGVELRNTTSFLAEGDSMRVSGTWVQTPNSSLRLKPTFSNTERLYLLKLHTASGVVFRNVTFEGISSSEGLLLTDRSDGRVGFGNTFTFPSCPVYLGSGERSNRSDYIQDIDKKIVFEVPDSIQFMNVRKQSYLITSSKSELYIKLNPGKTLKLPIGYTRTHFAPVEIRNTSQVDFFTVSALPWLYDWDLSFKSASDDTDKGNIKKNGVEIMWNIQAGNDATIADIYAQVDVNSTLMQKAYDQSVSCFVRYAGVVDNTVGNALSNSFWDYTSGTNNISYAIFPSAVSSQDAHTLQRIGISNMNQYSIFSLSSWMQDNRYPLFKKTPSAIWVSSEITTSSTGQGDVLKWTLENPALRTLEYDILFSNQDIATNPNSAKLLKKVSYQNQTTAYETDLSPSATLSRTTRYAIKLIPINEDLDTLIYTYDTFYVPYSFQGGGPGTISIYGNPISIASGRSVDFSVNINESIPIEYVDINIMSPSAIEGIIFTKRLYAPSASSLFFAIDPRLLNLSPGVYIVVAKVYYTNGQSTQAYNKFITR